MYGRVSKNNLPSTDVFDKYINKATYQTEFQLLIGLSIH